jgi:Tol biopolymer transport system component
MKTKIWFILIVLVGLIQCKQSDDELPEDINPELSGNVVFLKGQRLEMADVNKINSSKNYGDAIDDKRPVWSHDGSRFAAITPSDIPDALEIKITDINNNSITRWRINGKGPLTWSPDGSTIAFIKQRGTNIIYYLDIQNGDIIYTNLSMVSDGWISALAWHPDSKIAVNISSSHHDFQQKNDIWMIEPFDTELKNKISLNSGGIVEYMDWNSDGSKLLYSYSSFARISIINSDGSGNREIPEILGYAPCWSKDGAYILYTGIAGASGSTLIPGIFASDTNGSFDKLLLKNAGFCDWH